MPLFLLYLLVAVTRGTVIDESILITDTFTPPPEPVTEEIPFRPTGGIDKEGRNCTCVPYYQCEAVDMDDLTTANNGRPELDTRYEEPCQHYSELCCATPKNLLESKPQPDPTKVKGCGYRNLKGLGRDFKGTYTKFGEFPWVIALLSAENSSYLGAGVLISPDVVMTTAHIAVKYAPGTIRIRAGEWDTQTVNEIYSHQEREIRDISIHEEYNNKSLSNDIALLRLERPLELTEHISSICLPEQDELFDSAKSCVANGWGKDVFGRKGQYAVVLRKVELDMLPHDQCESLLRSTRLGTRFKLHDSFVCASEGNVDTCRGDGGAALACPIDNNQYKLTGLVAWGIGCGKKDIPAVYTNVSKYRRWVDEKIKTWGLPAAINA